MDNDTDGCMLMVGGFNTASGKYYCNAAREQNIDVNSVDMSFNTASGKYYCNKAKKQSSKALIL